MTFTLAGPSRIAIGIDPGLSGALVALGDGVPIDHLDTPVLSERSGRNSVNGSAVAAWLRGIRMSNPGASFLAVLERVGAMPGNGATSMFRFGQADGVIRGVIAALGLPLIEVEPQKWKQRMGCAKAEKDYARTVAIQRMPVAAEWFKRKKDIGRADAALIALWAHETEAAA